MIEKGQKKLKILDILFLPVGICVKVSAPNVWCNGTKNTFFVIIGAGGMHTETLNNCFNFYWVGGRGQGGIGKGRVCYQQKPHI